MGAKTSRWNHEKQDICIVSKLSCNKILPNYEGENSNFIMKKPGRHNLNQVIDININRDKSYGHCVPPDIMHWEGYSIFCGTLAQNTEPQLNHEITSDKLRDILQLNMKDKEKLMNYHRLESTKETRQLHAMWAPWLVVSVSTS